MGAPLESGVCNYGNQCSLKSGTPIGLDHYIFKVGVNSIRLAGEEGAVERQSNHVDTRSPGRVRHQTQKHLTTQKGGHYLFKVGVNSIRRQQCILVSSTSIRLDHYLFRVGVNSIRLMRRLLEGKLRLTQSQRGSNFDSCVTHGVWPIRSCM